MEEEEYDFDDRNKLAEDILKMLERGSPNDVKIKLSDGEIVAHKDILMARSDYFATMFSNNKFIEGETNAVDMRHCSKVVMEKIVKFLFSGTAMFNDLSLVELLELSHMARMMLLTKFQDQVDDYVSEILAGRSATGDIDELSSALKCANQFNLKEMEVKIIKEIIHELDCALDDDESYDPFKSLPFNLIRPIFQFDFDRSYGRPTTKKLFDSFVIWLSENEATEKQKDEIVNSFNFEDFTVEELLTSVRKSGLYNIGKIADRVHDLFKEQVSLVEHKKNLLEEKDNSIKERDDTIKEKDKLIKEKEKIIKDKEKLLKNKDYSIKNRDDILKHKDMMISDKDREIKRLRSQK